MAAPQPSPRGVRLHASAAEALGAVLEKNEHVMCLPRGGFIVNTEKAGGIQFMMPPETVKDAMILGIETPEHYVFPDRRFDKFNGVNLAEFEFPAYFNFFMKKRRINLICSEDGEQTIRRVFQETLFGPEHIDVDVDFAPHVPADARPDLKKELEFFRRNPFDQEKLLQIDTLLRFTLFDEDGHAEVAPGVVVSLENDGREFAVEEDGVELARLPAMIEINPRKAVAASRGVNHCSSVVFHPPTLGVTMLGTSHGFDPVGSTTGLVLWINGRGVIVDPPANSGQHLRNHHVPSALIDGVILTHCHADHDAGTFQKIIEEGKVMVLTTRTIKNSFVRKYSALTGLDPQFLSSLFEFKPVTIGETVSYRGGEFHFHYTLHSIPCIGFSFHYAGKKVVFSGDTCNDPPRIKKMEEEGVLSPARAASLIDFCWDADLILHEAGVPPLHTPCSTFISLPQEVKDKMYLVHIAAKDVPVDCGLKAAVAGVHNTISIDIEGHSHHDAIILVDLLASIELFKPLPLRHAAGLLSCSSKRSYAANEYIVNQGDPGTTFFIIASGEVVVEVDGICSNKVFTTGDFFGEISIFEAARIRTACILAITDLLIYEFDGERLLGVLEGTPVVERLRHIALMRQEESWGVMSLNRTLDKLSSGQRTQMQGLLYPKHFDEGSTIWEEGSEADIVVLVASGSVHLQAPQTNVTLFPGALIVEYNALIAPHDTRRISSVTALSESSVYVGDREPFMEFVKNNPFMYVAIWDEMFLL